MSKVVQFRDCAISFKLCYQSHQNTEYEWQFYINNYLDLQHWNSIYLIISQPHVYDI